MLKKKNTHSDSPSRALEATELTRDPTGLGPSPGLSPVF